MIIKLYASCNSGLIKIFYFGQSEGDKVMDRYYYRLEH